MIDPRKYELRTELYVNGKRTGYIFVTPTFKWSEAVQEIRAHSDTILDSVVARGLRQLERAVV